MAVLLTKKPPTIRDRFLDKILRRLQLDNELLTERMKILEKRLDFMQDETARLAIEEQALIMSLKPILEVAQGLLDKKGVPTEPTDPKGDSISPAYQ